MQKASPALKSDAAPQAADSDVALADVARHLRMRVIEMSHAAKTAHLASSLSCCDILAAAYWRVLKLDPANPGMATRDRFILSKGHAASALYAALAFRGYFPEALLDTFTKDGGKLAEHPPAHGLPGVEAATGSLGHGLPIGNGMAAGGPHSGTELPRLRCPLRRRMQRRLGMGSGDVRCRAEARQSLRRHRLQQVAGDGALQRDAGPGAASRQVGSVRLARRRGRRARSGSALPH